MSILENLERLKQEIILEDWNGVRDVYKLMTGEDISNIESLIPVTKVVKKKPGRPKKITEVIKQDKKPRVYEVLEPSPKPQKQLKKTTRNESSDIAEGERRQPRTEPVRFRGNSFIDDGTLALEDKAIDKKLKKGMGAKGWKRASPRPQHEFVEVECGTRSCDVLVQVPPELYMSDTTYFCTKCLSKKR